MVRVVTFRNAAAADGGLRRRSASNLAAEASVAADGFGSMPGAWLITLRVRVADPARTAWDEPDGFAVAVVVAKEDD